MYHIKVRELTLDDSIMRLRSPIIPIGHRGNSKSHERSVSFDVVRAYAFTKKNLLKHNSHRIFSDLRAIRLWQQNSPLTLEIPLLLLEKTHAGHSTAS
jgi:hypothetical protein